MFWEQFMFPIGWIWVTSFVPKWQREDQQDGFYRMSDVSGEHKDNLVSWITRNTYWSLYLWCLCGQDTKGGAWGNSWAWSQQQPAEGAELWDEELAWCGWWRHGSAALWEQCTQKTSQRVTRHFVLSVYSFVIVYMSKTSRFIMPFKIYRCQSSVASFFSYKHSPNAQLSTRITVWVVVFF